MWGMRGGGGGRWGELGKSAQERSGADRKGHNGAAYWLIYAQGKGRDATTSGELWW